MQDPDEALYPSMPLNAVQRLDVDYVLGAREIGSSLGQLATNPAPAEPTRCRTIQRRPADRAVGRCCSVSIRVLSSVAVREQALS